MQLVTVETLPNTTMSWLLYVLLGFLVLTIVVGALGVKERGQSKPSNEGATAKRVTRGSAKIKRPKKTTKPRASDPTERP